MEIKRLYHFQCSTKQSPAPTSGAGSCEINTTKGENKEMKHFFKKALSLALAILFTLGAVSVTAFVGLLPAAAEGESTLGATAACSGHTLGTFSGVPACVNDWNGGLHICENNFPDNDFRNYVSGSDFNVDGDGYFIASEIENVKRISCKNLFVDSLQGIEFFSNLTELDCISDYYGSSLTMLNVSNNAALTYLNCSYIQLTSLDLSNNAALTYLDCSANELTSLDLSNNVKLTQLNCSGNQLTSLDVSNNAALSSLNCNNNQLASLDVSNNAALTYLNCGYNQLTSLYLTNNTALTYLDCGRNKLTILYTDNNSMLTYLNCIYNQLQAISVRNISELVNLECSYNQLTMLDVTQNNKLETLCCYNNLLEELDVSKNTKLTGIACYSNMFTSLDFRNNSALELIYCKQNQLVTLNISNNISLSLLSCEENKLTSLDISNNTNLRSLNCMGNEITTLDVSNNVVLHDLTCNSNQLTSLDVRKNLDLEYLICSKNQLTTLDVSNNAKLWYLACTNNRLASLNVSNNPELTELSCYNNQLTSLDVTNNTKLRSASCSTQSIEIIVANRKAFNMRTLLPEENLSKVAIDSDIGTYDPETGIIAFNAERTSFKYYYDIGKNGSTMDVTVTLKMHEHTYGDYVSNGDGTHTRHCTFEGCTDTEAENCSGGTATCKDKAVCEICGEAYGELNPENHTGKEVWEQTETTHTKKWNCCGAVIVPESDHEFEDGVCTVCAYSCTHKDDNTDHKCDLCGVTVSTHTGGTATCKDKAICELCGEAYGDLDPENHTGKEVWEQTETKHTKKWSCCGAVTVPESDHKFEDGVCTVCAYPCTHKDENTDHLCDICGETVSNHSDENHDHLCDICGKSISNHADDDNNHICDLCGKAVSNHIDSNKDHICDICGKVVSNHVDDNTDHICDICGKTISNHIDDNTDHICDICGKAVSNHIDSNKDHICDICGKAVSNHVDDNKDHVCDICGKAVTNHVDDDNNHICDLCGKTVSNHSDENHDHICDICGETISAHTGGSATCKDKAICELCGKAYGELNPENHTGGTHIEHEKAATCTEKGYTGDTYCSGCNAKISDGSEIPTKPHTPGEKWVIENGKKVKKCTECGAIAETAPRMPGDVDGDGEITMLDCLYLKRYILGTYNGEIVLENADVDGNGRIDATDYLYLKRGYLGTFDLSKFA